MSIVQRVFEVRKTDPLRRGLRPILKNIDFVPSVFVRKTDPLRRGLRHIART